MKKNNALHNNEAVLITVHAGSEQDPNATSDYVIAAEGSSVCIPAY